MRKIILENQIYTVKILAGAMKRPSTSNKSARIIPLISRFLKTATSISFNLIREKILILRRENCDETKMRLELIENCRETFQSPKQQKLVAKQK